MSCSGVYTFKGCGKCRVDVTNYEFIRYCSALHVCKVGAKLINNGKFNDSESARGKVSYVGVSCTGQTIVKCKTKKCTVDSSIAKDTYCKLLGSWCMTHVAEHERIEYKYVEKQLGVISNTRNFSIFKCKATKLTTDLLNLYSCNSICTTINVDKKQSNCIFILSDIVRICKFNSHDVVEILSTVLSYFVNSDKGNKFFDINKTYVRCNANVSNGRKFIVCDSTFNESKRFCYEYIRLWCQYNCEKQSEVSSLLSLVATIEQRAMSVRDIHSDLCEFNEESRY